MQKQKNNFLGNVGLCARSRGCIWGSEACLEGIRNKKATLIFLDDSASANTKKRFSDACTFHHVPLFLFDATQWNIAQATGRMESKLIGIVSPSWTKPLFEQATECNIVNVNQGGYR